MLLDILLLNYTLTYPLKVELYYLHTPDTATPIEESLSAIQELYAAGKFKRVLQPLLSSI